MHAHANLHAAGVLTVCLEPLQGEAGVIVT